MSLHIGPVCTGRGKQAFFCALEKKLSRQKNSRFGKKLMVLAKKNSRYRNLAVIALHREQKKTQKTQKNSELSKKNSEIFQKNSRYRDLTVVKSRKSAQKKSLVYHNRCMAKKV